MTVLVKYIELILTGVGLLILTLMMLLFPESTESKWTIISVVALVISTLHGIIFFIVRSRQRRIRQTVIKEVSHMLQDRVNNKLTVVAMNVSGETVKDVEEVQTAIREVSTYVNSLSEESLKRWQTHYAKSGFSPRQS